MAKLTSNINSSLLNTGMGVLGKLMKTDDIPTNPELEDIFTKSEKVISDIEKSYQKEGFRKEEPIVIAQLPDGTVLGVADGNTRLFVAKKLGLEEVYVTYRTFNTIEDAKEYARNRQLHRRNLSQAEIYKYAENIEEVDDKNGEGRATERLAEDIGVSASTLQHARTVSKKAAPEVKEKVKKNEMSINQAYQTVRKKKPKTQEDDDTDEISDALDDTSGNPKGIVISDHSDGIERPDNKLSAEEDSERTLERKNAYEDGFVEGFLKAADYIFSQLKNDIFLEEVEKEINKAKKSYSKLSKFIPCEIETVDEELENQDLPFEETTESDLSSEIDDSFNIGFEEE